MLSCLPSKRKLSLRPSNVLQLFWLRHSNRCFCYNAQHTVPFKNSFRDGARQQNDRPLTSDQTPDGELRVCGSKPREWEADCFPWRCELGFFDPMANTMAADFLLRLWQEIYLWKISDQISQIYPNVEEKAMFSLAARSLKDERTVLIAYQLIKAPASGGRSSAGGLRGFRWRGRFLWRQSVWRS